MNNRQQNTNNHSSTNIAEAALRRASGDLGAGDTTASEPRTAWAAVLRRFTAMSSVRKWSQTGRFLAQTEVHVYALSIAASVLLSFFPFLIVIESICRYTLRWPAAVDAINLALMDYFPSDVGVFLARNLKAAVEQSGPTQVVSVLLLLFTANGVFEPLEVALNRVWAVPKNRSYIKNQLLSLALILVCGALVLGSLLLTAKDQEITRSVLHLRSLPAWLTFILFKLAALPITVSVLFLVYWILPNRKVPAPPLLAVSIYVGLALEALRYLFLFVSPWTTTKLMREYGPFHNSISILLLSFLSAMVVLAGAEWSARQLD